MADANLDAIMKMLLEAVKNNASAAPAPSAPECGCTCSSEVNIPVGISNRHIHLSEADMKVLFGEGYSLTNIKDLSQPGQFACKETVTICGPKGAIEKVRVLGPLRSKTQVEILHGDRFKLGVTAPARLSGDLAGTPGVTVIGPKGSVQLSEGLIVAQRHIHMTPQDAVMLGVHDGQEVSLKIDGPRGGVLSNVLIRANDTSKLDCHLDTDEANAMDINSSTKVTIIK